MNVLHFIYSWIGNLQTLLRFRPNIWISLSHFRSFLPLFAPVKISKRKEILHWHTATAHQLEEFFWKQLKSNDYDCDFNAMQTKTVKWIFMLHLRKLICAVRHDFRLKCCKQTSSSFDLFFRFWCMCECELQSARYTHTLVESVDVFDHVIRFINTLFITIPFYMCLFWKLPKYILSLSPYLFVCASKSFSPLRLLFIHSYSVFRITAYQTMKRK